MDTTENINENLLYKLMPQLADEWDETNNEGIEFNIITKGSSKKYWWVCSHDHHWQATPNARYRGSGCPYCSGRFAVVGENDLETMAPHLSKEWNYELNGLLKPCDVKPNSAKYAWWICSNCGQTWKSKISHRYSGSGCPYCDGKRAIPRKNDMAFLRPDVASEWNDEKNGSLHPSDVTVGSSKKVWWKCEKGHIWKATIHSRTYQNRGCPFCSTSRQTSFPEQAILFYVKQVFPDTVNRYLVNGNLEIDIYLPCLQTGIEYDGVFFHKNKLEADLKKDNLLLLSGIRIIRVREVGLPVDDIADVIIRHDFENLDSLNLCIHQVLALLSADRKVDVDVRRDWEKIVEFYHRVEYNRSIGVVKPDLIKEWHPTLNGSLSPYNVSYGSHWKVWWRCNSCGFEWVSSVAHRYGGRGCPNCSKIIQGKKRIITVIDKGAKTLDKIPQLAGEWLYDKNVGLIPSEVTCLSHKKVWWKCAICGNEWQASISNRVYGTGCPQCAAKKRVVSCHDTLLQKRDSLSSCRPDISIDWDYSKNTGFSPDMVLPGSGKRVWWKCHICGYEWEDTIAHRTSGRSCRMCRKT